MTPGLSERGNHAAARQPLLSVRPFVALLVAVALVLPLTGWLVVRIQGPQTEQDAFASLVAIVRLKTDQIENWLGERQKNAELLAADAVFAVQASRLLQNPAHGIVEQQAILERFSLLRSAFDYDRIELIAADGQVVSSLGEGWELPGRVVDLPDHHPQGERMVRLSMQSAGQGETLLQWLVPVYHLASGEPRFVAWVRLSISPQRFLFPVLQTWPTSSPSGETLLVTREGDQAVFMNELRHRSGTAMKLRFPMAQEDLPAAVALRSGAPGQVLGRDHRAVPVLAAYRPVAGTDWRVVAKVDRDEVLAPVHVLAWWVGGVTTLAMLALGVVLALFWRQIRQTQQWREWAQQQRSDRMMEQFFSLPFIGIATIDLRQRVWGRINRQFADIVGLSPERMRNTPWAALVSGPDNVHDCRGFARVAAGRDSVYAVDRRICRGDGTNAWVSLQLRRLAALHEGDSPQCVVMLQDITARVQSEARIQRQARLYAALSACNQAIVQSPDENVLFAHICETAVRLGGMQSAWIGRPALQGDDLVALAACGASPQALPGQGTARTALREDRAVWIEDLPGAAPTVAIALHCTGAVDAVFVLVAEPGQVFDEDAKRLLLEMATDVDFALGYFAHERQRRRTEQQLRQSQGQLELVLKGSTDAPWEWDLRTQRLEFSVQGWHMLGYGVADMPRGAMRWRTRIHPQDLRALPAALESLLRSDTTVVVQELRLRHKTGRYVPVLARGFVTRDAQGLPLRVTGTAMDLTLQHQTRQLDALRTHALELIASERDVGHILAQLLARLEAELPGVRAVVWLLDAQTGALVPRAAAGMAGLLDQASSALPAGPQDEARGMVDWGDAGQDLPQWPSPPLRCVVHSMAFSGGWRQCTALPIRSDSDGLLGVLDLHHKRKGQWPQHERTLVERVRHFLGSAVQRKAFEAQQRLAAEVFSHSNDGITVTDAHLKILLVNPAFTTITGYAADEVAGRNPRMLASGRHGGDFYGAMWRRIQEHGLWQGEIWNRRKDGGIYPEWLSISAVYNDAAQVTHYIGVFQDISERKQSEARIHHLAHHDALTGLPNRLLLEDRLNQGMLKSKRNKKSMAIVFIDLDRFKNINDTLGHEMGDKLLIQAAQRGLGVLRDTDTLSRQGGDEFVAVLPELEHRQDAMHVTRKLLAAICQPYQLAGHQLTVSGSAGIALYPDDGETVSELLRKADAAMYRAKDEGRNTFRFFSSEINTASLGELLLENDLRGALERNELVLHYQPKIDALSGEIVGAEALMRWQHREQGLIPPGRFIPLAEESGLIEKFGQWAIETVCAQQRRWLDAGVLAVPIAVNISANQFARADFPNMVAHCLAEHGIPPQLLELELTESMLMRNSSHTIQVLQTLRKLHIQLSIDDFGTGYSSLSYLKQFPVQTLKIDRSFVCEIDERGERVRLASAIIALAHELDMQVVAEGVETEAQRDYLREHGCDQFQGFLFGRPQPVEALAELLAGRRLEGLDG